MSQIHFERRFIVLCFVLVAVCSYAAYDGTKPRDDEFIADGPGLIRENFRALKEDGIVNAGAVSGYSVGSASGNIPRNEGSLNTNLNADKLDGYHASDFTASSSYSANDVLTKIKTVDGAGSGLDADLLDGYTASTTAAAPNTIPIRDASGYIQLGWINTTSGDNGTTTPTRIYASQDGYIRYYSLANFVTVTSMVTLTGTQTLTNKTLSTGCTWSGNTIADGYIAATIARDSDLTTHAGLTATHGATGAVMGTTNTQTVTNKTMSTGCTWNGNAIADGYIPSTIARDTEIDTDISTHAGVTATHGATGAVVGTTNTQTLSNKTYDVVTSSGWVTCNSGTTTNLVSLGTNQESNYSIQWSWYSTDSNIRYQGLAPGANYYCYYDKTTGYVKFSNSSGVTIYVRCVCIPIQ